LNDAKQETTNATRGYADIAADEIAAEWPSDVILSSDLGEELTEDEEGPAVSGPLLRSRGPACGDAVLRQAHQVRRQAAHCWLIRNHEKWLAAPSLLDEIRKGRGIGDSEYLKSGRQAAAVEQDRRRAAGAGEGRRRRAEGGRRRGRR
jgi:hypothetical protein